jgi:hypothetical protein
MYVYVPYDYFDKACQWFKDRGIQYRIPEDYGFTGNFCIEDPHDQTVFTILEDHYYRDFGIRYYHCD